MKKKHSAGLLLLGVLSFASFVEAAKVPWVGDKNGFDLGLRAGAFGDGINTFSLNGEYRAPWKLRVGGSIAKIDGEPNEASSSHVFISSNPYARFTGRLSVSKHSQDQFFDAQDIEIGGGWHLGKWYLEQSFVSGNLSYGSPEVDPEVLAFLDTLDLLTASRTGFSFAASYFAEDWALRAYYGAYQFERDGRLTVSALRNPLSGMTLQERSDLVAALRDPNRNEHFSRFFRTNHFSTYENYRQATHLVDSEISIDYTRVLSDMYLGLGYAWMDQVLDGKPVNAVYISGDYLVDSDTTFGCLVSTSDAKAGAYAEINITYTW